jgi:hypothetical protein
MQSRWPWLHRARVGKEGFIWSITNVLKKPFGHMAAGFLFALNYMQRGFIGEYAVKTIDKCHDKWFYDIIGMYTMISTEHVNQNSGKANKSFYVEG